MAGRRNNFSPSFKSHKQSIHTHTHTHTLSLSLSLSVSLSVSLLYILSLRPSLLPLSLSIQTASSHKTTHTSGKSCTALGRRALLHRTRLSTAHKIDYLAPPAGHDPSQAEGCWATPRFGNAEAKDGRTHAKLSHQHTAVCNQRIAIQHIDTD